MYAVPNVVVVVFFTLTDPVVQRGLLDRKITDEHLQSSNGSLNIIKSKAYVIVYCYYHVLWCTWYYIILFLGCF